MCSKFARTSSTTRGRQQVGEGWRRRHTVDNDVQGCSNDLHMQICQGVRICVSSGPSDKTRGVESHASSNT